MASSTAFDLIAASFGKTIEKLLVPSLAEVAVDVTLGFGEEPPSKDSMKLLFEEAFKKALNNPTKKSTPTKKDSKPKAKKTSDKSDESSDESVSKPSKPVKAKKASTPKPKKAPAPKPQWLSHNDVTEQLKDGGELNGKYFCGFVADRGANKGKYCCTLLTEEHNNCGKYDGDTWVPHTPEQELEEVGVGHSMRCKKCWAKNKEGHSRKPGAYDKLYKASVEETEDDVAVNDLPEVPELPVDNLIEAPVEELEHITDGADVLVEESFVDQDGNAINDGGDDEYNADTNGEEEDVALENTEDLLDGLL